MSETRLEKYKKYRESLDEFKTNVKTNDIEETRRSRIVTDTINTTSTLPLEEVVGKIDEESDDVSELILTKKKIKITILVTIGILLVAGIVVFAVIAFGGPHK